MELIEKAKKYIEELEILRDNLSFDYEENYNKILKIANNFDNDFEDIYLTDIFYDFDIVKEEEAECRLQNELNNGCGLDRARCFINDTTADTVYKISAYGNLENVHQSDFEEIIDELIWNIKYNLENV